MASNRTPLQPEDYQERACLLNMDPPEGKIPERPIPQRRVIEKMDEYMGRRDYEGALRHLKYWLEEARAGGDRRGELLVRGELVGHYRKMGNRDGALENAEETLRLLDELGFTDTVSGGTACVNAATAYHAFGEHRRAMEIFERAKEIYGKADEAARERREESDGDGVPAAGVDPALLGGLYNNMALACVALKRFDEAFLYYEKAMECMGKVPAGVLEQAITCLNMANAVEEQTGMEAGESRIYEYLDRAAALLDTPGVPHDGYYAFVCEKCAPTFSYYGYFMDAQRLQKAAEEIYERNGAV